MNITQYLESNLVEIVEIARLAPSVHNVQPWRVSVAQSGLAVHLDPEHRIKDGDPTGRQTIISLGIFSEAVCIALTVFGVTVERIDFETSTAIIVVKDTVGTRLVAAPEIVLLEQRCTDRSIYQPAAIEQDFIKALEGAATSSDVQVTVLTDRESIETVAQLTSQGIQLALSNPAFRAELSKYLVLPWSRKRRGISVKSLYIPRLLAFLEPWLIRLGIGLKTEVSLEKRRWQSASAVVIVTSVGDMPRYWFNVGRTYLRASLLIEQYGLSQATSAAIVEASDFHEDIEHLLQTNQRIQSILRVGKGARKRHHSPRLPAKELITSR